MRPGLSPKEIIKQLGCFSLCQKSPVPLICTSAKVHEGLRGHGRRGPGQGRNFSPPWSAKCLFSPQSAHLTSSLVKIYPPYFFMKVPWHSSAALPQTSRNPDRDHRCPKASGGVCVPWSLLGSETHCRGILLLFRLSPRPLWSYCFNVAQAGTWHLCPSGGHLPLNWCSRRWGNHCHHSPWKSQGFLLTLRHNFPFCSSPCG